MSGIASLGSKVFGAVVDTISKLPPEALPVLLDLFNAVKRSPDPLRALKRASMAATSSQLSEQVIKQRLKRR